MSTKVVSTKVESDLYDELLQACNEKGCTVSQFVKDACITAIEKKPEFSESESMDQKKETENSELVSELEGKITKLETDLSDANSTISKQKQTIKKYGEFVDPIVIHNWRLKRKTI